jgi:hypothetical protein
MPEIRKDNLERALGNPLSKPQNSQPQSSQPQMSREQEIMFHQGAITTLINERNELVKMVGQVDSVLAAHFKRLEELGVKLQKADSQGK